MRAQQCSATSQRSSQRCKRLAILGASVCATHGGLAPQVRRKAAERVAIAEAAEAGQVEDGERRHPWEVGLDALAKLDRVMRESDPADPGYVERVELALRSARAVLDSRSYEAWSARPPDAGFVAVAELHTVMTAAVNAGADAASLNHDQRVALVEGCQAYLDDEPAPEPLSVSVPVWEAPRVSEAGAGADRGGVPVRAGVQVASARVIGRPSSGEDYLDVEGYELSPGEAADWAEYEAAKADLDRLLTPREDSGAIPGGTVIGPAADRFERAKAKLQTWADEVSDDEVASEAEASAG
jgi:hypothetical protein